MWSRRAALALGGAFVLGPVTARAQTARDGADTDRAADPGPGASTATDGALPSFLPTAVIDAAFDMTSRPGMIDMLRARQVGCVFRYYAYKDQPERGLPNKVLRASEARALWDAGISIGAVFQYNNDRIESITPERGRADAEFALDHAQTVIGQPKDTAIYFGVDGSWSGADQMRGVLDYFTAVQSVFAARGAPYRVGAYGSGTVLGALLDRGLIELAWLALSRGWPGSRAFYNGDRWNLFQFSHHLAFGQNIVDGNVVNPNRTDIGAFYRTAPAPVLDFGTAFLLKDQFWFSNARRVPIYDAPRAGARKVADMTLAYNPIVLTSTDGWHAVSLDGTDRLAGYVQDKFLVPSGTMPAYR
ncbi:MAG: glycoside hydrolase domain-containing protein [Pseudomonadota bacterium]